MKSSKAQSYSKEFKGQIIKECIETNNYSAVAKKHGIPATTVYTWIQRDKKQVRINNKKNQRSLEKELSDAKLEIEILKELLKKTHQLWLRD